jgi:DNA modification methylase
MVGRLFVPQARGVPLAELRPWPGNPRRWSPVRLEELKHAMASDPAMLWARPVLALPDGRIFAGNMRLAAAVELGWPSLPTLTVDLEERRAQLWALRDNNSYGEWDTPALAELLSELVAEGVDASLTGFTSTDLDRILGSLVPERDPDEAPDLPDHEPDSKVGEIYQLGPHRLLCGDARDPDAIAALTQAEPVAMLLSDPPYGVSYTGKTKAGLRIRHDEPDELAELLDGVFSAADTVLELNCRFYVFSPAGPQGTVFRLALERVGWNFHQALVWIKNALVLGHSDHHYQHEDVLYGWKPGPGRPGRGRHRGSRWYGDNRQSTVLFCDRPARSEVHPTMKPTRLLESMLANSTRRGDTVLDPFCGSGSTLIACERLNRRCLAVELDPGYCDVIRQRYQGYCDG